MTWYALNNFTCIKAINKCGSQAIACGVSEIGGKEICPSEVFDYETRVLAVRHPIDRIRSLFSHVYHQSVCCGRFQGIPEGTVTALGYRIAVGPGPNDSRLSNELLATLSDLFAANIQIGYSRERMVEVRADCDQLDYCRFIDFILSKDTPVNTHWQPQHDQCIVDGDLAINKAIMFEDLPRFWDLETRCGLPRVNSHPKIFTDPYRLADLEKFYAQDLRIWMEGSQWL